jgi:glutamyl-tRNA reductase
MQLNAVIVDPIKHEMENLAKSADARILVMGGLSFRTAGIKVREKITFNEATMPAVLQSIAAHPAVDEVLLLSTCNRTEFYLVGNREEDWPLLLRQLVAAHSRATGDELAECLYCFEGEAVARHLFRVAAGLDSMVTGECEIVQQIKRATNAARDAATSGTILQRLAEKALAASKRARTQVRYDECGLSVASIAASACMRTFQDLKDVSVLVLGAGETAELTLHYLVNKGVKKDKIANRTIQRAQHLARLTNGTALPLAEFAQHLDTVDLVISCTSSPNPLVQLPCGSMSTTNTLRPSAATQQLRFTAVVVFPTPPF